MTRGRAALAALAAAVALLLTGCSGSDAQTVSDNLSKEADQFNVVRKIVVTNMVDNSVLWEVTGACSLELGRPEIIELTCREGPNEYKKHYLGTGGMYLSWAATQVDGVDVSRYQTKIIFRPQAIIPDVDIAVGEQ